MAHVLVEGQIGLTVIKEGEMLEAFRKHYGTGIKAGDVFLSGRIVGLPGEPKDGSGLSVGIVGPYETLEEASARGEPILQGRIRDAMYFAGLLYGGRVAEELTPERYESLRNSHPVGVIVEDTTSPATGGTTVH